MHPQTAECYSYSYSVSVWWGILQVDQILFLEIFVQNVLCQIFVHNVTHICNTVYGLVLPSICHFAQ